MSSCQICVEKFGRKGSGRERFHCPHCSEVACMACVERWIDDKAATSDPVCVHCSAELPDSSLFAAYGPGWLEEHVRLPRMDRMLEVERRAIPRLQGELRASENAKAQIEAAEAQVEALAKQLADAKVALTQLKMLAKGAMSDAKKRKAASRVAVAAGDPNVHPCPDCPGFMLENEGNNLECMLCQKIRCAKCLDGLGFAAGHEEELKADDFVQFMQELLPRGEVSSDSGGGDDDKEEADASEAHVCAPEDEQNISFIRESSKECPGCGHGVYRISGCAQMFCSQCKSSWNWNTGSLTRMGSNEQRNAGGLRRSLTQWRDMERSMASKLLVAQAYTDADLTSLLSACAAVADKAEKVRKQAQKSQKKLVSSRGNMRLSVIDGKLEAEDFRAQVERMEMQRRFDDEFSLALATLDEVGQRFQRSLANDITPTKLAWHLKAWTKATKVFNKQTKLIASSYGKKTIAISAQNKVETVSGRGTKRKVRG